MSDRATLQAELLLLCGKARDNTLTPGDAARLDELLQADDSAKALYVRYMTVVSLLESRGAGQRVTSEGPEPEALVGEDVFAELLQLESQAEAELVEKPKRLRLRAPGQSISGAARWVLARPAAIGAVAAMLAIALVYFTVFRGGPSAPPIAVDPVEGESSLADPVATLTGERDARWLNAGVSVGDSFVPGQRLELMRGVAEITTQQGAIVILESPCTIEMLDNDNALRLHAGKLVGICETESSKGLLIRTPQSDVVDLGTRFSVEVNQQGNVRTAVLP